MSIHARFDTGLGFWVVTCSEPLSLDAWLAEAARIRSGTAGPAAAPTLWDVRRVELASVQVGEMRDLVGGLYPGSEKRGAARVAILVSGKADYGVARMYVVHAEELGRQMAVFEDEARAEDWLQQP